MQDSFQKRVVITGGSAGLGLAMAKALIGRGTRVTALARDAERLAAAEAAGAVTIAGEATDAGLMDRVVAEEQPDVLILNAGSRMPAALIDEQTWASFSALWETDVKATLFGIQAALKAPMKPGSRVLIISSGAAMVLSVPFIDPYGLRLSGGSVGAKRMQWFMAHSANAAALERGLDIQFQALLPMQLIGGTEFGREIASAYARIEGVTPEQHILNTYGSELLPDEVGSHVAELLDDARYAKGVAYGIRAGAGIVPLDV